MNVLLLRLTLWLHRLTTRRLIQEFPDEYQDILRRHKKYSQLIAHEFLLDYEESLRRRRT